MGIDDNSFIKSIGRRTDVAQTVKSDTITVEAAVKGILDLLGIPTVFTSVFTTSSASSPADSVLAATVGADYMIGAQIIPLSGACAVGGVMQKREVTGFDINGYYTLDADFPAATGLVSYLAIPNSPGNQLALTALATAVADLSTATTESSTEITDNQNDIMEAIQALSDKLDLYLG